MHVAAPAALGPLLALQPAEALLLEHLRRCINQAQDSRCGEAVKCPALPLQHPLLQRRWRRPLGRAGGQRGGPTRASLSLHNHMQMG